MKKTLILAASLALLSSNAMATDYFSTYGKSKAVIEVSAINHEFKRGDIDEDQIGGRIRYESQGSNGLGYQLSHEGFRYDEHGVELTQQLSTVGLNYNINLFTPRVFLKPEAGVYHTQTKLEAKNGGKAKSKDTKAYGKVALGAELIRNSLFAKAEYTYYDIDDTLDNGQKLEDSKVEKYGVQVNYMFNRDFDLFLSAERIEDFNMFGIGLAIKY